jgi:uncharacterized membrane protein YccC
LLRLSLVRKNDGAYQFYFYYLEQLDPQLERAIVRSHLNLQLHLKNSGVIRHIHKMALTLLIPY